LSKSVYYETIFLPFQPSFMFRSGLLLATAVFIISCKAIHVPVKAEYEDYRISPALPVDSAVWRLLQPYRDSVNRSMNDIIGTVDATLEKKQPQGSLGDFMADALLFAAKNKFGVNADVATVNYGGVRLGQLTAGPVTRGKIFELMPFDNLLVLQELKGSVLQQFLDMTAERKGWPLAGVSMQIENNKAVNVRIGGQPIDPNKMYTMVNSDYVANGGDNASMLKGIPQKNIGYLMRDALFDYIKALKAQGKNISVKEEKRVYAQ
jgi:2',3'-cyclic-nucleotide 2'-phosphodiesterase (5'-nucleotidase family)